MTESEKTRFSKAMFDVFDIYNKDANDRTINLYWELLKSFDTEDVLNGIEAVLRSSKFFPKPAEIIEQITGNEQQIIDYEFENACEMIKTLGFHDSVILKNKVLMIVINDLGGLHFFSEDYFRDSKDLYFRFARAYKRRAHDYKNGCLPEVDRLIGYNETLGNQNAHGGIYSAIVWDNKPVKKIESVTKEAIEHMKILESQKRIAGPEPEPEINHIISDREKITSIEDVIELIGNGVMAIN